MRKISVSEILTYLRCREEHRRQWVEGYRSKHQSLEQRFGTGAHAGRAVWWETHNLDAALIAFRAEATKQNLDIFEIVRGEVMLTGYNARWIDDHQTIETVFAERFFSLQRFPFGVEPYELIGFVDSAGRIAGEGFVSELKTTSSEIGPGSDYWTQLSMDWQVSLYAIVAPSLGLVADRCLYDVMRKPELEPLKATPIESRKYTKATAATKTKPAEPARLYANQRERDETPEEFRDRLIEKIADKPEEFYGRRWVIRLEHEIERALRDIDTIAADIMRSEPGEPQPRTPAACRRFGHSKCPFWGPCAGLEDINSDRFVRLERKL